MNYSVPNESELLRFVWSFEDPSSQPLQFQIFSYKSNLLENSEGRCGLGEAQINEKKQIILIFRCQ